ncbi:hypothetical protein FBU59_006245 [Linderina macrospora]|uniref:Uncharacterized protein n=1 Tax=Linderina macrospora TaxID=4868 RepID=A0ACC1J0B5_9FUNG|nr:hypothetical protein FBU59_006245 [Linderina macrospora]
MQLQEMRVTAQLNLVELLVDMGDAAGAFRELMLSWTLMAENNIAETRASWFLLAARVWALKQYPTITSMYLSLAMRDAHTMAEAQLAECRKLERHIELQLKGDAKACFKSKQLAEAQRLIDAGRINEANEKLMELTTGSELESRQQAARMLEEISDM